MLTIQSAISVEESVKMLLVPHNITTLFSDRGIGRFMASIPEFSDFIVKSHGILHYLWSEDPKFVGTPHIVIP